MKRILGWREQTRNADTSSALAAWPRTPMLMVARGLIFADTDVLYDDSLWLRWLHALIRRERGTGSFAEFRQAWDVASAEMYAGRRTIGEALHLLLETFEIPATLRTELAVVAQTRRTRLTADCRPFPGVVRAMQSLAEQGFALALLANCEFPGPQLQHRLECLGLTHFHVIVTSCDLGIAKPHPNAYLTAAAQLQLAIDDVIYVGGDEHDLSGADAVGLRTVSCSDGVETSCRVRSLAELNQHVSPRWPLGRTG